MIKDQPIMLLYTLTIVSKTLVPSAKKEIIENIKEITLMKININNINKAFPNIF